MYCELCAGRNYCDDSPVMVEGEFESLKHRNGRMDDQPPLTRPVVAILRKV